MLNVCSRVVGDLNDHISEVESSIILLLGMYVYPSSKEGLRFGITWGGCTLLYSEDFEELKGDEEFLEREIKKMIIEEMKLIKDFFKLIRI